MRVPGAESEGCNTYSCPSHAMDANGRLREKTNLGQTTGFLPTPWDMSKGDILQNITLGKVH